MSVTVKRTPGAGVKNLETLIKGLGDKQGQVGWFSSAQYEDGTPVAYVATIQEFGSPRNSIPPRSFMRTTIMEKKASWAALIGGASKMILAGNLTAAKAMLGLVTQAKGDVQAKIASIHDPALSPITLGLRKVKMGRVPGLDRKVTGKTVGIVASMIRAGTLDVSDVPDKPLIEPTSIAGGGTLYTSIDAKVD